jgi:hypothetical protein
MYRIFVLPVTLFLAISISGQTITPQLKFKQGQMLNVTLQMTTTISQEAMGQAIDFKVDGSAFQTYKVTNATNDNTTLHHDVKKIAFNFDGMGQKKSFDSDNEKDLNGQMGKPIKELLKKNFDIVVDEGGTVLMARPEKQDSVASDDRMKIITNLLKDVLDVVQPPKKGAGSLFRCLPTTPVKKGDKWQEKIADESGQYTTTYTLTDITDSTIVISFEGTSTTISKAEMMGNPTTTTMHNKTTGNILLDKSTYILKQKTYTTESNGTTEAMGGTLPVTSKRTTTITVN